MKKYKKLNKNIKFKSNDKKKLKEFIILFFFLNVKDLTTFK